MHSPAPAVTAAGATTTTTITVLPDVNLHHTNTRHVIVVSEQSGEPSSPVWRPIPQQQDQQLPGKHLQLTGPGETPTATLAMSDQSVMWHNIK
ncbi:hypothetical protein E2C01_078676 [Portunus trituberculatus]|uniref:Uncharacterized protein n=1 Tax=Portunus trituberculatus TaxID=210409 RepID=A0A5B7ING5_PORTR|nr:hypothetical protein [Portunus trituberculatus]